MSGISMAGMGTGLDIYGMAQQLAMVQTQPKAMQLSRREATIDSEIAALNELTSSLNSFYNALNKHSTVTGFGSVSVNMAEDDEQFAGITVDDTAMPNTYQLQIDELAQQHKLQLFTVDAVGDDEDGSSAGAIPAELAGEYRFHINGEEMVIDIEKGMNIADVATAINEDPDNPGLTASILSDGDQTYLTLTSNDTGRDNSIQVTKLDGYPIKPIELQPAKDAEFFIDGIRMTSPDNRIENAIPGVTIDLKDVTGTDDVFSFDIRSDVSKMTSSAQSIVSAYNDVINVLDSLGGRSVDDQGNVVRGPLAGDPMISGIRNEMRSVLQMQFDEPYTSLASIGIITNRNGDLEVDSTVLREALEEEPKAVTDMFIDVVEGLQDVATKYIGRPEADDSEDDDEDGVEPPPGAGDDKYIPKDGLIDARLENLDRDKRAIESEWQTVETRYESIYQRYLNQFIAMDLAVAQMQSSMMFY